MEIGHRPAALVTALAAALAVALGASACSGGAPAQGPSSAAPTTAAPAAADPAADPCALLSDQDIATAAGRAPTTHKAGSGAGLATEPTSCFWKAGSSGVAELDVWTDQVTANYDSGRSGLFYDDKTPSPGIGDQSYWRLPGYSTGPGLYFVAKGMLFAVTLDQDKHNQFSNADAAAYRNKTVPLARAILAKL